MRRFKFKLWRDETERTRKVRRAGIQILAVLGAIALIQKPGLQPGPELSVFPGSIDFGEQPVGAASQPRSATIVNLGLTGNVARTLSLEGGDSKEFRFTGCAGTELLPRGECDISIRFQPRDGGSYSATLRVVGEDGSSDTVLLSGTGTRDSEVTLAPSLLQFGSQSVDTVSEPRSFSLRNHGKTNVSVTWEGPRALAAFKVEPAHCLDGSLGPGEDCQVEVRFAPTSGGASRAAVILQKLGPGQLRARLSQAPVAKGQNSAVALVGSGTTPEPAVLTVDTGAGGRVTSRQGGISCPGVCTLAAPAGTELDLVAEADPGWKFEGWPGAGCGPSTCHVVLSKGTTSVSAHFSVRPKHQLTVDFQDAPNCVAGAATRATASVTSDPNGLSCVTRPTKLLNSVLTRVNPTRTPPKAAMFAAQVPKTGQGTSRPPGDVPGCSAWFTEGTPVRLTAGVQRPWRIDLQAKGCGGGSECVVRLDTDMRVAAQICELIQ